MKQRKLSDSVRETLEKAALLGEEFSVPVLLSAGASSRGLDRLFDEGWLAEAGANRARFVEPVTRSRDRGRDPLVAKTQMALRACTSVRSAASAAS